MQCTRETQKKPTSSAKNKPTAWVELLTIAELLQGSDGRERWDTDFALLQLFHWLGLLQEVLVQLSLQRCQSETEQELCSLSLPPNQPRLSSSIYTVDSFFFFFFFSYSMDSLELPPRLMVEHWYLNPELEEKLADTLHSPRALLYTAAQSMPAGWRNHQLQLVHPCFKRKSNILTMATITLLKGSSHHKHWSAFCNFSVLPVAPPISQADYMLSDTCSRPPARSSLAGIWTECLKFFGLNTCREGN